jgi:hypothetical protein
LEEFVFASVAVPSILAIVVSALLSRVGEVWERICFATSSQSAS